jgi:hypothetical protein
MPRGLTASVFLALLLGTSFPGEPGGGDRAQRHLRGIGYAKRLLALPYELSKDVKEKQELIDSLLSLKEDARPGLDHLLIGCLQRTLEPGHGSRQLMLLCLTVRATWSSVKWVPEREGLDVEGPVSDETATRCIWLFDFLRKCNKHRFLGDHPGAIYAEYWHSENPGKTLLQDIEGPESSAHRRWQQLHLVEKYIKADRERLVKALLINMGSDSLDIVSTSVALAAKLKLRGTVTSLSYLLDWHVPVRSTGDLLGRKVFWGAADGTDTGDFEPTVGQLAAYAIQEITGRDFGFVSCYESRNDMPQILARIRKAFPKRSWSEPLKKPPVPREE